MQASCSLQSELRRTFCDWLAVTSWQHFVYAIVARVCSPGRKGHDDSECHPLLPLCLRSLLRVPTITCWQKLKNRGLRSLRDLTQHLTARVTTAMQHLAPCPCGNGPSLNLSRAFWPVFLAYHRIKPHAPLFVRTPVNSLSFTVAGVLQVDYHRFC